MFEYHNDILSVRVSWLVNEANIFSSANYHKLKNRGWIKVTRRGCKGTPALIEFSSIPDRFKNVIVDKYGDPRKTTRNRKFIDYLIKDSEALKFFKEYTLESGDKLPEDTIQEYVVNSTILKACQVLLTNRRAKSSALGGKVSSIWVQLSAIIEELPSYDYPHSLPRNSRSLNRKYKAFIKEGYESLIHRNFANKNSEKINPDAQLWLISRFADQVKKVATIDQLWHEYNLRADQEGWKSLRDGKSIHNFLNKPEVKHLWYGKRYGELKAKEKFTAHIKTSLPTMRDSLWYSDGTKLNYYYLSSENKVKTCQVYEVMDAFSEVFLGFHISDTEDFKAQYSAYKMAVKNAGHRPYQIGFDNQGGHKKLQNGEFLTKLSRVAVKAQPYNGKSKTIESAFGRFQMQFLKKDWFFTGQNITTKSLESKGNLEFIMANKNNLPTLEEIKEVYAKRREEWNSARRPGTDKTRLELYLDSQNPEAPAIELFDMVDLFWLLRENPIKCAPSGIAFQEKKERFEYMVTTEDGLPNVQWLKKNIDKKFFIKYDPEDMSLIYLYEKTTLGLRFVTEAKTRISISRGIQEQETWEAEYTRKIIQLNKNSRLQSAEEINEILESHKATPEDYGLKTPKLRGVNKKKPKKKPNQKNLEKVLSNMVEPLEENEGLDPFDLM